MDNSFIKTIVSLVLWPFAALGIFFCCFILLIIMVFIHPRHLSPVVRFLCTLALISSGIVLRIEGKSNVQKKKPYLWMINHQSFYDVFIGPGMLPQYAVGVEASRHFNWPVWKWVIKRWGNIPIERKNLDSAIESIRIAKETLENGTSIIIAPEGTRTITGKMGVFKKGPFHLAIGAKAEIVPVGIHGAYDIKKKTDWRIQPGVVSVKIGKPIPFKQYEDMEINQVIEFVRGKILTLSGEQ